MSIRLLILSVFLLQLSLAATQATTLGYWRFEEGTPGNTASGAGTILDSAGSNPGTPTGSPVYNMDVPVPTVPQNGLANGVSLDFNGTSSTVVIPTVDPGLDGSGPFTVEFWMRSGDTRSGQRLLMDKTHGVVDSTGWFFQTAAAGVGDVQFGLFNGSGGTPLVTSNASLFDDQWYHLAGVYDGSQIEFFVNGNSQGTAAVAGGYAANTRDIRMGSLSFMGGDVRHYDGLLDEVRISDEALSPSQFLNQVPEPSSLLLLAIGAVSLFRRSRP